MISDRLRKTLPAAPLCDDEDWSAGVSILARDAVDFSGNPLFPELRTTCSVPDQKLSAGGVK